MQTVMVISIIIVGVVLLLAMLTTSKAYAFKHTVDPVDELPSQEDNENLKKAGTDE